MNIYDLKQLLEEYPDSCHIKLEDENGDLIDILNTVRENSNTVVILREDI